MMFPETTYWGLGDLSRVGFGGDDEALVRVVMEEIKERWFGLRHLEFDRDGWHHEIRLYDDYDDYYCELENGEIAIGRVRHLIGMKCDVL